MVYLSVCLPVALDDLAVSHYLTYFKLTVQICLQYSLFLHAEGCQGKYKQKLSIIMTIENDRTAIFLYRVVRDDIYVMMAFEWRA